MDLARFSKRTMTKIKFLIFISVFVQNMLTNAQTDFAWVNYSHLPTTDFDNTYGKASLTNVEIVFFTPTIKIRKKINITNGLSYRLSQYDYERLNLNQTYFPKTIHDIRESIIIKDSINKLWSLLFVPRINIRSDFKGPINSKDIFPAFLAIAIRTSKKNHNLKYGVGLNYNNDFAKNYIIPIIAFEYSTTRFKLKFSLPSSASFILLPNKKIECGFAFYTDVAIYHLGNNAANCLNIRYLRTVNLFIPTMLSYHMSGNVWINGRFGYAFLRQFDYYNQDFKAPSSTFENRFNSSLFFLLGISLRTNR